MPEYVYPPRGTVAAESAEAALYALRNRWGRFALWSPDDSAFSFRAALSRFETGSTEVLPDGLTFNGSIWHRRLTRAGGEAGFAIVVAEPDGQGSLSLQAGFELLCVRRLVSTAAAHSAFFGALATVGTFGVPTPGLFPDPKSLANVVGLGAFVTDDSGSGGLGPTPLADLDMVASSGTTPATRSAARVAGGRLAGSWALLHIQAERGGPVTGTVRNLSADAEVASVELATNLPGAARLGMIYYDNVRASGIDAVADLGFIAMGYP